MALSFPTAGRIASTAVIRAASATSDTAVPALATDGAAVPLGPQSRGSRTHLIVKTTGALSAASGRVTIYGYVAETETWYTLAQLNQGVDLAPTSKTVLTHGTGGFQIHYAEAVDGMTAYDRLAARVTGIAPVTASFEVRAGWEEL